ncbi:MAG: hypothetical protein KKA07_14615 [Bacteroidetes bacterium]|nr:hypothetical protein [Bacteroidota bacterium]MBU1720293.1 hypothetical protein [Bacteroidota bacterium]
MKRVIVVFLLLLAMVLFSQFSCDKDVQEMDKLPAYFINCNVNGAYKEYTVNKAWYNPEKNLTIVKGYSTLFGELQIAWKGQKSAPGSVVSNGIENAYMSFRESPESIDTLKTTNFTYGVVKYGKPGEKIAGVFSGTMLVDSQTVVFHLADTLRDTLGVVFSIEPYDSVGKQKVPRYSVEVTKGKFSVYRSEDAIWID